MTTLATPLSSSSTSKRKSTSNDGTFHARRRKKMSQQMASITAEELEDRLKKRQAWIVDHCYFIENDSQRDKITSATTTMTSISPATTPAVGISLEFDATALPRQMDPSFFYQGIRALRQSRDYNLRKRRHTLAREPLGEATIPESYSDNTSLALAEAKCSKEIEFKWNRWQTSDIKPFVLKLLKLLLMSLSRSAALEYKSDHLFLLHWQRQLLVPDEGYSFISNMYRAYYSMQRRLVAPEPDKINRIEDKPQPTIRLFFSDMLPQLCARMLAMVHRHRNVAVKSTFPSYLSNQMTMDTPQLLELQDVFIWQLEPSAHVLQIHETNTCVQCHRPLIYLKKESRGTCKCNGETITLFQQRQVQTDNPKLPTEYERKKTFRYVIEQYVEGPMSVQVEHHKKLKILKQKCTDRGVMGRAYVNKSALKEIIQGLGWESAARNFHRLYNDITGVQYTLFTREQANMLMRMFSVLEIAFNTLKGTNILVRLTFPRVDFAISQFCRMMGDGWRGASRAFQTQKVNRVLDYQVADWKHLVTEMIRIDPKGPWKSYDAR